MEELKEIEEFDDSWEYEKRAGNNVNKNYKKGARRKVYALLMYSGVLVLKSSYLVSGSHVSLLHCINRMEKEGLVVKEKSHGYYYLAIPKNNVEYKDIASKFFPDALLSHYLKFGKVQTEKMRARAVNVKPKAGTPKNEVAKIRMYNRKAVVDADRVARNSETIMFMDGAEINMIPGGYEYSETPETVDSKPELFGNGSITDAFYTFSELRECLGERLMFNNTSSRINGVVFSRGGNYLIYNFSSNFRKITQQPENSLKDVLNDYLPQKGMEMLKGPVILYKKETLARELFSPATKEQENWYINLTDSFIHAYLLPLAPEGQKLMKLMTVENWDTRLMTLLNSALNQKMHDCYDKDIACHGIITYTKKPSGQRVERYAFFFTVPDMIKFKGFITCTKAMCNKDKFEVICFDYQRELVESLVGKYAYVNAYPFEPIFEAFMKTFVPSTRL